ncbi:Transcriptional regulatory protein LiaR [Pontiella desulfatans]|uniref:Transcriptional regulatory protein LiaR n=1 Tax=Pontiella desulfatans TaxID=2750659 RepID=A0A6C2UE38_PONDE|nr:response regulator transcription factor [Pontiella desulfatans]VGO17691.1 Transcriptional regulatory protein LiaR [Pontiella desulfatans]
MKRAMRIMLVEDNPDYREVIEMAINKTAGMELTGKYGAAEVALNSLQDRDLRIEPDIVLLDLNLPAMSGLEALPFFRRSIPDAKVIILTQSDKEADVVTAIRQGASGYILKSSTIKQIKQGIRDVMDGDAPLDAGVATHIMKALKAKPIKERPERELSPRELEILTLLGEGFVKKEIGDKLDITYGTVATHVRNIYEKLNVINAPAAISKAYQSGILPMDPEE